MKISRICAEFWNKFKNKCDSYFRALLVIIGVAGALFAGHQLDVNAYGNDPTKVDFDISMSSNDLVNIDSDTWAANKYSPFKLKCDYSGERIPTTFFDVKSTNTLGEFKLQYSYDVEYHTESGASYSNIPLHCILQVDRDNYDVLTHDSSTGSGWIYSNFDDFEVTGEDWEEGAEIIRLYEHSQAEICVAKKPKVIIRDTSGNDITNKFNIVADFKLEAPMRTDQSRPGYAHYVARTLSIKPKGDSGLPELCKEKLKLTKGGTDFTYNDSSGAVTLEGYEGKTDVEFCAYGKTVYFASETDGMGTPWTNQFFAESYDKPELETDLSNINASVSPSDDYSKGSWKMTYDESKVQGNSFDAVFSVNSHDHYEFNTALVIPVGSNVSVIGEPSLSGGPLNNKNLNFKIRVNKSVSGSETVKIGDQKYTEYTNIFSYEKSGYKLKDLVTAYRFFFFFMGDEILPNSDGALEERWSVADTGYDKDNDKLNAAYAIMPKDGYAIDRAATVKVNNEPLQLTDSELEYGFYVPDPPVDEYPRGVMTIVWLYPIQNNSIVIDNIKKHYDVTFKPKDGTYVETDINVNGSASNWRKSITSNLALDEDFKVTLNLVNDRKTFKESADDIKSAIIAANTNLSELGCVRNSGTQVTLTIPHSSSAREIIIPDNLFDWKKSDADFSIDFSFADPAYKTVILQSIKLYKGTDTTETNLIELREGSNSNLVNVATQEDISYDNLIFTIKLSDSTYVDLSGATVSLDGGLDGEAKKIEGQSGSDVFVFRLDPNLAGAPHRSSVRFKINGLKTNLKPVTIALCPKAILYFVNSDGSLNHIATAPNDYGAQVSVGVPVNDAGANYVVVYPDYSKIFGIEQIKPENVTVTSNLESLNRVRFNVKDPQEGAVIRCEDPAQTAPPIKFTPIEGLNYYNLKDTGEINPESPIHGTINIPYGQTYSFAVKCNEGYDASTLELKANDNVFGSAEGFTKEQKDDYYVFTIDGSKAIYPITINGNIRAMQKKIIFNKNLGGDFGNCDYIYNGASVDNVTVLYGQGITFEVTLPEKCNQSDIKVKFNDTELSKVNGRYVLNNITSDGTITVSNVSLNKYPVTFASNARATYKKKDGSGLSGTVDVSHGDSFEFRVQPNSGYTMGENSVVYLKYADGRTTTLQPSNDVYKISNLTQACTVSVENVEDIVYTITLVPTAGVTYLNDVDNVIKDYVKIKHGRNFEFSVSLSDEYDDSLGGMNIIVNDGRSAQSSAQKLASGRYVIPNVSEDMTIKVGNVRKNTYTVTLTGAEGIDYYDASGKVITGDNQAEHYSDFSFKVDLYPAYAGSDITVMLGDTPMSPDSNGFYTISKISESKTVTVVGIEQNDESLLVNKINNLPDGLSDLGDVDDVIEATKAYEALSDSQKALIGNADKLKALQEQVKQFHHVSNDVRISGVDWHIKLYAIPMTDDTDACGRIYKKLGSEYILSLYNVYLWDTLNDTRYTLPEGQSAVVTLPTPDMTYFEKPTAIHEKDGGKIVFITPSISGGTTTFETDSFSLMGIVANRSNTPGRSSLLDAADANLDAISNFAASVFGNDTNKITRSGSGDRDYSDLSGDSDNDDMSGNIDEKFRSRNNRVTATSSALRLILVLMILILMGLMIYFFIKRRKDNKKANKE